MTKEVLNKLPENILVTIENYKKQYNGLPDRKDENRGRMAGYVQGLRDAGAITERERQAIFVYMTV